MRVIHLYEIVVWWKSTCIDSNSQILRKVERTVEVGITGARGTTTSLSVILDILPIDLVAKETAAKADVRLKAIGQSIEKDYEQEINIFTADNQAVLKALETPFLKFYEVS
uniref:Uncharacterized protein n=1 Tax=Megaselia scalaris TaxID=36166 RepID=T1GE11_MEGSC